MKSFTENRLLLSIILPVLVIGTAISILLPAYLSPKLHTIINSRNDALMNNAIRKAVSICEERFNDLLDLRMTSNTEMNTASLNQAIEGIKDIHGDAANIHMLVITKQKDVVGSTLPFSDIDVPALLSAMPRQDQIVQVSLAQGQFHMTHRYFPFWKIHIFGLISSADYSAPVVLAKRIVHLGTFGVLLTVLVVLVLLFTQYVNRPLQTLIKATQSIRSEDPQKIAVTRKDEIGKLSMAFNSMVDNLVEDKRQIREMMRELRDSEEQYRILSEYSLTHIAMIQKGRLIFLNHTMAQAVGLNDQEFGQAPFFDLIDPRDRLMVVDRLSALETGERKTDHFECRLKHSDGADVWLDVLATLALYRETHAVLFHAVNISRRKGLETKLSQAQKLEAIGTLAGGVAHDLNNILSSLLGYPELLLLDLPEDSPLCQPLLQIQRSAERAAEIVQDLLTMARRGVDVKEVLNLNLIVREYVQSLEHEKIAASHPKVLFESEVADDLLNMKGSPIHLTKSLMNLVRNAAESIPREGRVVIRTGNRYLEPGQHANDALPEGDYVVLTVEDNGSGISKVDVEHIFEPFYTKKVMGHSGTGLGMSVVLGTVQDHFGRVDVSSRKGMGTTIALFFPATRRAPEVPACPTPFETYSGKGEKLLVVDDIEEQRDLMVEILDRFGYSTAAVASGEAAVDYVSENPIDLVLLDMIMDPGIDGLETLKQLLKIAPDQKAILLSGYSETERVMEALELGAAAYLKKPVVMEKLGIAVHNALCVEDKDDD